MHWSVPEPVADDTGYAIADLLRIFVEIHRQALDLNSNAGYAADTFQVRRNGVTDPKQFIEIQRRHTTLDYPNSF